MTRVLFLYRFEFPSRENPRGRKEEFEANLKSFLAAKGMRCGMSALGGSRFTMGIVHRETDAITLLDREAFKEWAIAQPVKCTGGGILFTGSSAQDVLVVSFGLDDERSCEL